MSKKNISQTLAPRNPKQNGTEHPVHINWFPYYAGYNSGFVHDVLKSLKIKPGDSILDPWNGSGTTTTTAYRMGAKAIGCDINPVMAVAAKSALLDPGTAPSLVPLADELLHVANNLKLTRSDDPLNTWYLPSSAYNLRRIHHAIWKVLVENTSLPSFDPDTRSGLSTIAAFYLTALFRTTRSFLSPFIGSNPTWIRSPHSIRNRIRPTQKILFNRFRQEVEVMSYKLEDAFKNGLKEPVHSSNPLINVASSTSIPLNNCSIKAVIASPPYLTRIDYAVATKPELATLGMSLSEEFKDLRKSMLGSPAVNLNEDNGSRFGDSCEEFIASVKAHPSKGSVSYYHKLFLQYFSDMKRSLTEISRILEKKGTCVLVVQDSYYKEIHADLANYVSEIGTLSGLKLFNRHDFEWNRNMARVNSRSRKYRHSSPATESVLWLTKN